MRVISGYLKGRRLFFPEKRKELRATKDVVREAIFDSLRGWVINKRVMEIFAGTGALGIEAISHGAKEVVFVEEDREAVNCIKKNIEHLGISEYCTVKRGKAEQLVEEFSDEKFDLIIADPPYGYPTGKIVQILRNILELKILDDEGIIVIEHNKRNVLPETDGFTVYKEKFYGKSVVSYIKVKKQGLEK
ncbi:MAG: 16S rRNA (guanine(966)-N(2))-methyltransferase RsmD [Candidatus Omnitrophica bacterium]|nr:16S rRNA (guanine(966)-N(2))-methyltransferase RsmD [Candidatus Omnitrophota bacterium]MCM8777276.1 16S rRNA (guanine(966)-N(2))-methyltransferase RsmD [Candidatus Omnitrophota bacterium]